MPTVTSPRLHHLALTVTDVDASVRWYEEVFGIRFQMDVPHDGGVGKLLADDSRQLMIVLHRHDANTGMTFGESVTGLDHAGFMVPSRGDLQAWQVHLESKGVTRADVADKPLSQSPIADEPYASVLVFRDPDNIQLEALRASQRLVRQEEHPMRNTAGTSRTITWRRRTMRLAAGISGAALAATSASAGSASASPTAQHAKIQDFTFSTGAGHLTGAGHTWSLNISIEAFGSIGINAIGFGITTPHLGGTEHHTWGGQLASADLSVSSAAVMTLNSRSSLSPVASLNLTFTPASHKTESGDCISGKDIVYTGALKGSVRLSTGLKGLKLRAAHLSFGGHNTLTVSKDCVLAPCQITTWDSTSGRPGTAAFATGGTIAVPGHSASTAIIQRIVKLPGKNKLVRFDLWAILTRAPAFIKSSKSLSVTSSAAGLVTGAATLSRGRPSGPPPGTLKVCDFDGRKYAQTYTQYLNARYESTRPFEAHTILNGTVKVKRSATAYFDIVTLSRK